MEPKILADSEHENHRLVELEAIHEVDKHSSFSLLYTASMTEGGVTLRRISSNEPSTQFYLDANVMNALAAGWAKFQEDMEARIRAEEEQRQALIAEAHALAAQYPQIKIETDGTASPSWWRTSIPSQVYHFMQPAYEPAQLLYQVKVCAEVLDAQQKHVAGDAA